MLSLSLVQPHLAHPEAPFLLDGYRITVAGVALGEPREAVEERLGAGRRVMDRVYVYARDVVVQYEGGVTWVSGPSLERDGQPLLFRGVPRRRMAQVFPERRLATGKVEYEVRSRAAQFDGIVMCRPGWRDLRFGR